MEVWGHRGMVLWAREYDLRIVLGVLEQKTKINYGREGIELDVNQTRYHCATDPFTKMFKKIKL